MLTDQELRLASALREARAQVAAARTAAHAARAREPVAIVGIGCRFPGGVTGPDDLWDMVSRGIDATTEQPTDRWDVDRYYDPDPDLAGKIYSRRGGFLDHVDTFDADFFGISPREATAMDPQQRLLLEIAWEALENAGISPQRIRGTDTGLYIGFSWRDYDRITVADRPEDMSSYAGLGNTPSIAVGRIAYFLDLNGPVSMVDTACSSSLVAVHQAVQSLQQEDSSIALAGGVNLILSPLSTLFCCRIRALSADGRCKTFDASADGYGRAEGCGIVVLKRLSDAQRDGDRIYAVIRGSAINHDGHSGGLTVPSARAQEAVIRRALRAADIDPAKVTYVEAHGTGTALGDPIEIGALNAVFGAPGGRPPGADPLWVGSIKSNLGHAETAAGIAGVIKAALTVGHAVIPPSLHVQEPNPRIAWEDGPARVATGPVPWPEGSRVAGVSSFGFSGTNAHVILEQAPPDPAIETGSSAERSTGLLTLSARTPNGLRAQAARFAAVLRTAEPPDLASICRTANLGRAVFPHRLALAVDSPPVAAAALASLAVGSRTPGSRTGHVPSGRTVRTALLIGHPTRGIEPIDQATRRGSQAARRAVEACVAAGVGGPRFEAALDTGLTAEDARRAPGLADAVAFTHRYAIARHMEALGLLRSAVLLGVGVGEYVAAVLSGVLDVSTALRLLAAAEAIDVSGLVVCSAHEQAVTRTVAECGGRVDHRVRNEYLVRVEPERHEDLVAQLRAAGVAVSTQADLRVHVGRLNDDDDVVCRDPEIMMVSPHTGARLGRAAPAPASWMTRSLWPAALERAFDSLHEAGCTVFAEVAGTDLIRTGRTALPSDDLIWVSTGLNRDGLAPCLAQLFTAGAVDDLRDFHSEHHPRVTLPTYPFERRRFWPEAVIADVGPGPQRPATAVPAAATPGLRDLGEDRFLMVRATTATVTRCIRQVLELAEYDRLDMDTPLQTVGFDSLMAVELRNLLAHELGTPLEATFAFDFATPAAQVQVIIDRLVSSESGPEHPSDGGPVLPPATAQPTGAAPGDALEENELIALALTEVAALRTDLR